MMISDRQCRRIAKQVAAHNPQHEDEALEWIELVSEFDNPRQGKSRTGRADASKKPARLRNDKLDR